MSGQRPQFHSIPLRQHRPAQERQTTLQPPLPKQSYVSRVAMPAMPDDKMYVTRATPTSIRRYTDA